MRVDKTCWRRYLSGLVALVLVVLLPGCGGGGGGTPASTISISTPTSAASYATNWNSVRLGGAISHAGNVYVRNELTGFIGDGYVFYNQEGIGTWFADVTGLGFGENPITVTAGSDANAGQAHITIIRPLQPADLIINGPNQASAPTFWTDGSAFGGAHKIAFFADGTGRSTTGSTMSENAGSVVSFVWSKLSPDAIIVTNCPTCSFQKISRITGSVSDGVFLGQVESVGGAGAIALDGFTLTSGGL